MNHTPSLRLRRFRPAEGSILITTLLMITLMSMLLVVILARVSSRHAATYQSVVWNEALTSAEAGSDFAIQTLNKSISNPGTAWTGWKQSDGTPSTDTNPFPKYYNFHPSDHLGESNTKVFAKLTVDVPPLQLQWKRIRSTGVAECPHGTQEGTEAAVRDINGVKNHRGVLRKVRFSNAKDLTNAVLNLPQVARTVEIMAQKPGTALYTRAITTQNEIKLAASPFYIDSFDSSNTAKSTNGQYDVTKRQSHADVASNSSGGISTLVNAHVYGNASSNGGAIAGTTNLHGTLYNNFSTTIPVVAKPVFLSQSPTYNAITNPSGPVTLVGGTASFPVNYKLTDLTISSSVNKLILNTHAVGQESYINIWVTGAVTISGTGIIQQNPNVHVQLYSEGSIVIGGSGWQNQTTKAANLLVYGIEPATYSLRDFRVNAGTFIGVFNGGRTFDITLANNASFIGAAIGRETDFTGCTGFFHYDEDLANLGGGNGGTNYQVASWVEDIYTEDVL